jgi:7-cyano-7-deazaguanine synthase in queuosine biosynthesis
MGQTPCPLLRLVKAQTINAGTQEVGEVKKEKHVCYEDNQGYCHNGCGRILEPMSARAYHGDEKYIQILQQRMWKLEKLLEDLGHADLL